MKKIKLISNYIGALCWLIIIWEFWYKFFDIDKVLTVLAICGALCVIADIIEAILRHYNSEK